jgi:methanol--5-hydroxybenzimidazolylcobamide Co-methyltransferase
VRLLSGNAPEAYAETLIYDCRLMNGASAKGSAFALRDLLSESDEWLSLQAAVLSPEATITIARAIVAETGDYARTIAAGRAAVAILRDGMARNGLVISKKELQWLDRIESVLDSLPDTAGALQGEMTEQYGSLYDPATYGLI